jgi:alanine racemase
MSSFNRVIIDSAALANNYRSLRRKAGQGVRFMAMVKSDAYGHSIVHTAKILSAGGCDLFGVAEIDEAVALRDSGCSGEIFVFVGFDHADVDYFYTHRLTPVVFSLDDLGVISAANKKFNTALTVYLKFDCGMGRLGFDPQEAEKVIETCRSLAIQPAGMMSHFPCSDDRSSDHSRRASETFYRIGAKSQVDGKSRFEGSICNSGGILYHPYAHGDLVRSGIAVYGYYPDGAEGRQDERDGLCPAMACVTRVIQTKIVPAGTGISYGHTYITERPTRLAVLPIGYSNGYFRTMSNKAEVLIAGRRAPIRGRICMNMCMADITGIEGVETGTEAVLMGRQGHETIDADEIGDWAGTISYEVLCSLGNNNNREFVT